MDGQLIPNETHVDLRVRYAETDRMGVAHHSAYLLWFEVGRTEYCRSAGFSYADMENQTGILLMVADVRCRYKFGVTYDDLIRVSTRISRLDSRSITFEYRIMALASQRIAAEGSSMHLPVHPGKGRTRFPSPFFESLEGRFRSP